MCDDYSIVNTPFSGILTGPVSQRDPDGHQYDGVKLLSDGKEQKIQYNPVYLKLPRQGKETSKD